ncbi:N(5)-(carboxyethyl)ornithine synthase [Heyndrickxia sporothermodurans]|uniref:N(5)-(carboxyethyl)ornithine synthase n=1 Tax=Heyndrickxia sporothermodurans TaxID=46224 RepID=UPI002E1DCDCC|nr:N(5)-(carboxyethyl)ornithine synthase [Heyndrickxia sporothermodurans]MED3696923.1 N(5)-(carboxyethyl)ornithine synthase [Heyndrickxia sporothermodurans]
MKTIGFPISTKENETRRALLPEHISKIKNKDNIFIEKNYGDVLGYTDEDYMNQGVHVVSKDEVLQKDVICDPKIGDADYLDNLLDGQIIFGYIHAVQNRDITDKILRRKNTAIAWEDMYKKGRHIFWRNNELAGEAAIMHAFTLYGKLPYECKVAVIGKGNIARGASRILASLGAEIVVYDRKMESLLRDEIGDYDVIVNGILWDTNRTDHLIYKEDLKRMKRNSMIVDISCDRGGGIESSIPTSIVDPVYVMDGVLHYVVDHTPSLIFRTVSKFFGQEIVQYLDDIIEDKIEKNKVLKDAMIIKSGVILDQRIIDFQKR